MRVLSDQKYSDDQKRSYHYRYSWYGDGPCPLQGRKNPKKQTPKWRKFARVLKTHDEAMTSHNLTEVMACFTEKAAIMGTGPGERVRIRF
jgi:hypothetical protein